MLDEALVWAAKSDRVDAIELLVELGARVDADPYRGTPLAWAAANGRVAAIRTLVELGADPNQRGTFGGPDHGEGVTALHLAAQSGKRRRSRRCSSWAPIRRCATTARRRPAGWAEHRATPSWRRYSARERRSRSGRRARRPRAARRGPGGRRRRPLADDPAAR